MNWLKSVPGSTPVRKHEPGVTSLALENHWKQAREVMLNSRDPEAAITVISHFNQMISLLRLSKDDQGSWPICKEFWMKNRCSDEAIRWLHDLGAQRCDKDDLKLVQTLQSLLLLVSEDGQLLGYFSSKNGSTTDTECNSSDTEYLYNSNNDQREPWDGACSLSTLLLELCISVDPRISETARNSFVLLIQLASKYPELENSISQEARVGVTNMTISGLSACFAQLPTFCPATDEQLQPFIQQLYFVDSVVNVATDNLSTTIADCFSKNFLYAVILPALTQDEGRSLHTRDDQNDYVRSLHEEIAVVTSYLQIVCESITNPILVKSLVTFIMNQLLTILLHRMNHPSTAVTVATLSLLNVLLELYCEDLWYEMILRHLMPQNHLMVSERFKGLPEVDFQDSALRFISFLPTSVTDIVGPESVSHNFMQYADSEELRWCAIDSVGHPTEVPRIDRALKSSSSAGEGEDQLKEEGACANDATLTCSQRQSENAADTSTKKCSSSDSSTSVARGPNPVFPTWKFRYDGSDKLEDGETPSSLVNQNLRSNSINLSPQSSGALPKSKLRVSEEEERLVVTQVGEVLESVPVGIDPLSEERFTTVSLQGGTHSDEMSSIGIGMSETSFDSEAFSSNAASNSVALVNGTSSNGNRRLDSFTTEQSDGYSSMESGGTVENVATFGPFVDCLFNHLANFTKLDPDVILLVTELLSTLAASRIPLITSLFLNHQMTLQPSFRSFLLILNRIRLELDKNVRSQTSLVTEIWGQMTREQARLEQDTVGNNSINGQGSILSSPFSDSAPFYSSFGENFADNLKSKLNTNGKAWMAAAMNAVFQRKTVPTSLSANQLSQHQNDLVQPSTNRGRSGSTGSQLQELNKVMVTRAIYFTHWLLELSAIATLQCWRR